MSLQSGMSAQLSEARGGDPLGAVSLVDPLSRPRVRTDKALRYELNVVAVDAAAMVSGIGGWLFDRAMAGWRVSVTADVHTDERALQILGLRAVELSGAQPSGGEEAVVLTAVAADRLESTEDRFTLHRPGGDVVLFGAHGRDRLGDTVQPVQYRPSAAALAFKAYALGVAGVEREPVARVETLFRCGRTAGLFDADLVPVC